MIFGVASAIFEIKYSLSFNCPSCLLKSSFNLANSTVFGIGAAVFGKSAKKVFRDMKTDHVLKHGTVLL